MDINGSPTSKEMFGIVCSSNNSQDLFDDVNSDGVKTPLLLNKKRPCFRSPLNSGASSNIISPLTSTVCKSVQGIYCSQEVTKTFHYII